MIGKSHKTMIGWLVGLLLSGVVFVLVARAEDAAQGPKTCVTWTTEAKFVGYAYNHYVHLDNSCEARFICRVTTDVNPDPITANVEPKSKKTVLTFRGSPSAQFKAEVQCAKD